MSAKQKTAKNPQFTVVVEDILEFSFNETVDANRVLDRLKHKGKHDSSNIPSSPVRIALFEDSVVANRPLWWPNSNETRLMYKHIRGLYSFEKKVKKLCLDIASQETQQRRVLVVKLKDAVERVKILEALEKYKMHSSMYDEKNIRLVKFGNWSSRYQVQQDDTGEENKEPEVQKIQVQPIQQSEPAELTEPSTAAFRGSILPRTALPEEKSSGNELTRVVEQSVETGTGLPTQTNIHIIFQGIHPDTLMASEEVGEGNERYITLTPVNQGRRSNALVRTPSGGLVDLNMAEDYEQRLVYPNVYQQPYLDRRVSDYANQMYTEPQMYSRESMGERLKPQRETPSGMSTQGASNTNYQQSHYVTLWKQRVNAVKGFGYPDHPERTYSYGPSEPPYAEELSDPGLYQANYYIKPRKSEDFNTGTNTEINFYKLNPSNPGRPDQRGSRYAFVSMEQPTD